MKAVKLTKRDMARLHRMHDQWRVTENLLLAKYGLPVRGSLRMQHIHELDLLAKVIAYLEQPLPGTAQDRGPK